MPLKEADDVSSWRHEGVGSKWEYPGKEENYAAERSDHAVKLC